MATAKSWRVVLAVSAVLVVLPGCGSQTEGRAAADRTSSQTPAPASVAAAAKRKAQQAAPLTPKQRRQAQRVLKQLRKQTSKPPRSVVSDSGLIP